MMTWTPTLMLLTALFGPPVQGEVGSPPTTQRLSVQGVDSAPPRDAVDDARLERLAKAVADNPRDREARVAHARGLIAAGKPGDALNAVKAWREVDAYNLVVVRLLGDLLTELGRPAEALRAYSAVTELLATDPEAHRALATILKQQGDLDAAHQRLTVARSLRPNDARIRFELADVALRLERREEARTLLSSIVDDDSAPQQLRHPAKQRLAQVFAQVRRSANAAGDTTAAETAAAEIEALSLKGGTVNDIKIYLTWDTDRTDVDLWVRTPSGEKIFYSHTKGRHGAALFDDVTSGYGPESFTAPKARTGAYQVQVNYFGGSGSADKEARGEVLVVLNEGRDDEAQHSFPYRLFKKKQTITVAKIEVAR